MDPLDIERKLCEEMGIPVDVHEASEKLRRLMATRNEWSLYKRKCDRTGQAMISAYPASAPFPVYSNAVWWGDDWNALDYGQEFDFNRPFFEQFAELRKKVPREGTSIVNCENCDYNSHTRESRNCYLNSLTVRCEDVLYSYWMVDTKDSIDCRNAYKSTLCYWACDVDNSYQCVVLERARNCNECYFSFDLKNCDHCIFSSNLNQKSYYAFNRPCSEEEFKALKEGALNGTWTSWQEAYQKFLELRGKAIHRYTQMLNCENCSGDYSDNCKNCIQCFDADHSEDCFNAISLSDSKNVVNAYSAGWPGDEKVYNSCVTRGSIDIAYCTYTWNSTLLRYCDSSSVCQNCFGCIGLKHKQYCILNKQYSKEEYEALLPRVVEHMKQTGEWGEFFPQKISVFAYNESAANDYFPLSKEEVLERGYLWKEPEPKAEVASTVEALHCEKCGKQYRTTSQELKFYERMKLPVPHACYLCRHKERFLLRNPLFLHDRKCDHCGMQIQSTYPAGCKEQVYCEKCYLAAVY